MSLRNSSEFLLLLSLLVEKMNRDRRSVSWAFSLLELFLDLIMFMAKSWTVEMDCPKMVSEPRLKCFLIFQRKGRAYRKRSALRLAARSKARANGEEERLQEESKTRNEWSWLKAIMQTLSNAKRSKMS